MSDAEHLPQAFFADPASCDRRWLLVQAQRARRSGRRRRAIELYQLVLAEEPDNVELAVQLAPLLAWAGRHFESWSLFRKAGKTLLRCGRLEWCLSVFRDATRCLPFEFEAWRICAELEQKLRRPEDARETLLEGRQHFRSPALRGQAIALLRLARQIDPWNAEIVIDLAQQFAHNDQAHEASMLLAELALCCDPSDLRRVRAAQWRLTQAPQTIWLWLTAAWREFRGPKPAPEPPPQSPATPLFEWPALR